MKKKKKCFREKLKSRLYKYNLIYFSSIKFGNNFSKRTNASSIITELQFSTMRKTSLAHPEVKYTKLIRTLK